VPKRYVQDSKVAVRHGVCTRTQSRHAEDPGYPPVFWFNGRKYRREDHLELYERACAGRAKLTPADYAALDGEHAEDYGTPPAVDPDKLAYLERARAALAAKRDAEKASTEPEAAPA
jgi:hypothetical protein